MSLLQQLTRKNETEQLPNTLPTITIDDQTQVAYEDAKLCSGRTPNLKASLETLYEQFFTKTKQDDRTQHQLKQPYIIEKESLSVKSMNGIEEENKVLSQKEALQTEINTLKQEGIQLMDNPSVLEKLKPQSKAKFWIGLVFLVPLSFYIFIFYISTAYSAFFKEFDPNVSLFHTIFEAKALNKALEAGWLEAGFVALIPFVFFSLGYLIHMFWSRKKWSGYIKVAILFIVTFTFDAILAYLIDEKEYNFNKSFNSPEFSISHAFQDPTFWLIIFAGFVSYIVWGLVFDMVMIEHAKRDTLTFFRKNHQEKLRLKYKELEKLQEKHDAIEEENTQYKVRQKELECIIDGFILPIQNYKVTAITYLKGWQQYIAAELPIGQDEKTTLLNACATTYQDHLQKLDLVADEYQNKVFTKNH